MKQVLKPVFDQNSARVIDFFFDEKSQVIYFLKSVNNQKIKFSCKVKMPNVVKAKRFANEEMQRRFGRKKNRITPLIKEELELWLKVKESEGWKTDTMNNIRRAKSSIAEFWGDRFPHEINRDNLVLWYEWYAQNKPGQMENDVKYLRNFCGYLAEKVLNGIPLLPAVPAIKDPNYRETRAARKKKKELILSLQDLTAIYRTAESPAHQILALFMYTMATRITETLTLRFGQEIMMDDEMPTYRWTIGQNKADLWGRHAIHSRLIEPMRKLREIRKAEGTALLFPQLRDNQAPLKEQQVDWEAWRKRANIGWHWTPHTFRHTCLSNLFNDEKNPQALICKLYRVSLAVALEHYIKPTTSGVLKMRDSIEVNI